MTLNILDLEEVKKHLPDSGRQPNLESSSIHEEFPTLTGQLLAQRLGGLLPLDRLEVLEANIVESCEQEND